MSFKNIWLPGKLKVYGSFYIDEKYLKAKAKERYNIDYQKKEKKITFTTLRNINTYNWINSK